MLLCKVDNESSWEDAIFLTFDIDWAHDSLLADTIDFVEAAGVNAICLITHDTLPLDRLRANPKFELGIHPNFNFLLEGDGHNGLNARDDRAVSRHRAWRQDQFAVTL